MTPLNVDSILGVNGYHISGQIRVRDRELVAQELRDENAVLRVRLGQLAAENAELREGMAG